MLFATYCPNPVRCRQQRYDSAGQRSIGSETNRMGAFCVDEKVCLNYNYRRNDCRNCRDVCPNGCWTDGAGPEKCDSCGLCQAVCPVDAIGVEGISADGWSEVAADQASVKAFGCRRQTAGEWACLGFLTAKDMVALAAGGEKPHGCEIAIRDHACRDCRPIVAKHLTREVDVAADFLRQLGRGRIVHGQQALSQAPIDKKLNRRSFFGSLLTTGLQAARNVAWPEKSLSPLNKGASRLALLEDLAVGPAEQNIFPVLQVADHCIACGLCARVCPARALTAVTSGDGIELVHHPLLCRDCGLCIEHCPEAAVIRLPQGPAGRKLLIRQSFPRCNECGASFQPAGRQLTCFDCLAKGRRSIFEP